MPLVLAKITMNDIQYIKLPNLITRDLAQADKFSNTTLRIEGFHYITLEQADEEMKNMIMKQA